MGWNKPELRERLTEVHARFRGIFENYFGQAMREYGLDETQFPLKVIVAAVTSFQLGLIVEGLVQRERRPRGAARLDREFGSTRWRLPRAGDEPVTTPLRHAERPRLECL